jgi:hypothetical protein
MTHALQSYSEGRWQDGPGERRPLLDAATGEVVATIPARGPDVAAMLAHARTGGGEELGGLRAVRHYLQRTAAQGHPDLLARLIPGGPQDLEGER